MSKRKKHKSHHGRLDSMTAFISTTMVLILVGTTVFFTVMADSLSRTVKENFTVEILLEDSISLSQTKAMQSELTAMPYAKHVTYISKDQATKAMAEAYDTDPTEFTGYSPFPASFEVNLKADYTVKDSLDRYMPSLKKAVGVMDVIYPEDLMSVVNQNIKNVSIILLVIASLLALVSIALINNTVRLNIARRRHTIQTMKLVGANWSFIRRPFIRRALWIGLFAALIADGILFGGITTLMQWDGEIAALITPVIIGITLLSVFVFGVVLTLISAFFSVNKHLGMTADEAALY